MVAVALAETSLLQQADSEHLLLVETQPADEIAKRSAENFGTVAAASSAFLPCSYLLLPTHERDQKRFGHQPLVRY